MRITGGRLRGRTVKVPDTELVRPTQDRVREALFSMLQQVVPGAKTLDLFAGSGALGIEALSRGAASATFVELDARHAARLKANLAELRLEARTIRADAYKYVFPGGEAFDLVFADPPYALAAERGFESLMASIPVAEGGFFVGETAASHHPGTPKGWELVKDREYGKTRICIWRKPNQEKTA